ncbi:hypothetical protein D9601_15160 [Sphingomonas sp. MA1305]|nr:hypothetical protein [Sphingomonas sp. MA1305]
MADRKRRARGQPGVHQLSARSFSQRYPAVASIDQTAGLTIEGLPVAPLETLVIPQREQQAFVASYITVEDECEGAGRREKLRLRLLSPETLDLMDQHGRCGAAEQGKDGGYSDKMGPQRSQRRTFFRQRVILVC